MQQAEDAATSYPSLHHDTHELKDYGVIGERTRLSLQNMLDSLDADESTKDWRTEFKGKAEMALKATIPNLARAFPVKAIRDSFERVGLGDKMNVRKMLARTKLITEEFTNRVVDIFSSPV
jgi:hypothetical protein